MAERDEPRSSSEQTRQEPRRRGRPSNLAVDWKPPHVEASSVSIARMYDYYLGGKDNLAIDREIATRVLTRLPNARVVAMENRRFLVRVVRKLVNDFGVRQFLDIGTGIPASPNIHELAQAVAPESRIVYVDNDPVVLSHARARMGGDPRGEMAYLDADLRRPEQIVNSALVRRMLDFEQPTALILIGVLHLVGSPNLTELVRQLVDPLPRGSFVAMAHLTDEYDPLGMGAGREIVREAGATVAYRDADALEQLFFDLGLRLLDPGVVLVSGWYPDAGSLPQSAAMVSNNGGVALKP